MTLEELNKLKQENYPLFLETVKNLSKETPKYKEITKRELSNVEIGLRLKGRKITWADKIAKVRKENGNDQWTEERRKKHSETKKKLVNEEFKNKIRKGIKNSESHKKAAEGNAERNKRFKLNKISLLCSLVGDIFSLQEALNVTEGKIPKPSLRKYLNEKEFFEKIVGGCGGGMTAEKVIYKKLKSPTNI